MGKSYKLVSVLILFLFLGAKSQAQSFCDSTGNIAIFSNYDGGILRINVDKNIPNLQIGINSYENDSVILSGPFLSNVTKVIYAGYYNSNNVHCAAQTPKIKSINGAPAGTDTIIFAPPAVTSNPNGYYVIICNTSCNTTSNQGGCNTADQVAEYFFSMFGSRNFLFHRTQYGCWSGTYNISSGGNCCATAAALPVANFTSSDSVFCDESGRCIDFTDLSTGNPTSWKWTFPGATPDTSTQQNPKNICYYVPGTYAVSLVVTNAAGKDSLTISPEILFLEGPPLPPITISHDTLFSSYAASYQWYYNGSPIPGATDSFYVAVQGGLYNVYITDAYGCSRLGNGVTFVFDDDIANHSRIKIYPNPAGGELWVMGYELWVGSTMVEIYNVLGENVLQSEIMNQKSEINVAGLPNGVYMVEVKNGERVYHTKFVKE